MIRRFQDADGEKNTARLSRLNSSMLARRRSKSADL
ncbi:hypothetical protein PFWH6_2781 [Pseudomonas fluorescens WH6]|nr:hypothetical protein PFWH6_2781 [Pseudomonas fluorescens WH6]